MKYILFAIACLFALSCFASALTCGAGEGKCIAPGSGKLACYNKKTHYCCKGTMMCPLGTKCCGAHCYDSSLYTCSKGNLVLRAAPADAPKKRSSRRSGSSKKSRGTKRSGSSKKSSNERRKKQEVPKKSKTNRSSQKQSSKKGSQRGSRH